MTNDPKRPAAVPDDAEWIAAYLEWNGEKPGATGQGLYCQWDKEGTLIGECAGYYQDNRFVCDGINLRFTAEGNIFSLGQWRKGQIQEAATYRLKGPSMDPPFPDNLSENIWKMEDFFKAGQMVSRKYFTKAGEEVDRAGKPVAKKGSS